MRRLLLVSSSAIHGTGYLEHCEEQLRKLYADIERVLFVPYALHDRAGYAARARERFAEVGLGLDSVHEAEDAVRAVEQAQGMFIGGGNTFRLLKTLYDEGLIEPIRRRALTGMPYMGTSAGSNVAGASIMTTNDMPIVYPPTFEALRIVPFQINPHYIDPDPSSTHLGETRDTRLREFHEMNETPVIAIREGAMLAVEGDSMRLEGSSGGKLFLHGADPEPCSAGQDLSSFLK